MVIIIHDYSSIRSLGFLYIKGSAYQTPGRKAISPKPETRIRQTLIMIQVYLYMNHRMICLNVSVCVYVHVYVCSDLEWRYFVLPSFVEDFKFMLFFSLSRYESVTHVITQKMKIHRWLKINNYPIRDFVFTGHK